MYIHTSWEVVGNGVISDHEMWVWFKFVHVEFAIHIGWGL